MIPCIGIDLGTTFSCVAVWKNDRPEVIANESGSRTTPSCVAFNDVECLVGAAAVNYALDNPENVIFAVKRLMGRDFHDPCVQKDAANRLFDLVEDSNNALAIRVRFEGKLVSYRPEEISAKILAKLRKAAEDFLSVEVTDAVITVPTYFNVAQRKATELAGKLAGLNVKRLISEPTAAALAYGLNRRSPQRPTVLVFDLGGGTLDVSLVTVDNGVVKVKATAGVSHLGGGDFTNLIVDWCKSEFQRDNPTKVISLSKSALQRLRSHCEEAKKLLSSQKKINIFVDALFETINFKKTLTRTKFEELCEKLFQSCLEPIKQVLDESNVAKSSVDEILMVGGSSRIPMIEKMVSDFFNGKNVSKKISPDEAVACGAAVLANLLHSSESKCPVDIVPQSIGVESLGCMMTKVIPKDTKIPAQATAKRITCHDFQTMIRFRVFEGENNLTKENKLLGEFTLNNITPKQRGAVKIEMIFKVNAERILDVSATEKLTGTSSSITIDKRGDDTKPTK